MNAAALRDRIVNLYAGFTGLAARAQAGGLLAARLTLFYVFWRSGLGKVETVTLFELGGFRFRLPTPIIQGDTFYLFKDEFFPIVPDRCFDDASAAGCFLPLAATNTAAVLATAAELTLPLLLLLGLFTRLGALGLLTMTLVIQLLVFPTWDHWTNPAMWWAATALVLVAHGPGAWSLDRRLGLEKG